MDIHDYQICGERGSGTTWLDILLRDNLEFKNHFEFGCKYGCKHWLLVENDNFLKEDTDHTLFVVIYKNPYSWLLSINKFPHHAPQLYNKPFDEFVRSEWRCYQGKHHFKQNGKMMPNMEIVKDENEMMWERSKNVIELRYKKIEAFQSLKDLVKHVYYVRYEDLLDHPKRVIRDIANKFNIKRKNTTVVVSKKYRDNKKLLFNKKEYYLNKEYMKKISPELLKEINEQLDERIENSIGYELEST